MTTKIKQYRQLMSLKQEDLAEMVGVRRETIIRLEKGMYNPSLRLAMDIAGIFKVPVEELFSFKNEEDNKI